MPLVSIIMPVYNAEAYLEQTVQSILKQSFQDFELIMVNDGSADQSTVIMDGYTADSRVKVIHKENAGVSAARNDGLAAAKGRYISFVDSDDEISEHFYEKVMAQTAAEPDLLMTGYYKEKVNEKEEILSQEPVRMKGGSYTKSSPPDWQVDANSLAMLGYIWNKIYKKELLDRYSLRFKEGMDFLEDIDFNAAVFKQAQTFIVLEDCLYHYKRRSRTSLVSTFRENDFEMQLEAIEKRRDILTDWGFALEQAEAAAAYLHIHAVKGYCVNLFLNQNSLSFPERCDYLNEVIDQPLTQERAEKFQPQNMIDQILKRTVGKRRGYALALISTLYAASRKAVQLKI